MSRLPVSVIQFSAGPDKASNLQRAFQLTRKALQRGAKFVVLPEHFLYRGPALHTAAETIPGPALKSFQALALAHSAWIVPGSIAEKIHGSKKVYNTSVLINPHGKIAGIYRKIHLFDVTVDGKNMAESSYMKPGPKTALFKGPGVLVGMAICYDLRFSGLFEFYAKKGARILTLPSSFTRTTGQAHWEILVRARAIETQSFVLAPNQSGIGSQGIATYGHSLIVDPWGKVLAQAGDQKDKILHAELDLRNQSDLRRRFPFIEHHRHFR